MESDPGYWYAMLIKPKIDTGPEYGERRRKLLDDLRIFLHEPNKFFYFMEEEAPNNIGTDLKWMQYINRTRIVGK